MAENIAFQNSLSATTVGGTADLRMPVAATPARTPGSIGLVGSTVQVRLADQTILTLGGAAPTPNLQQVTAAGNSTTLGINVGGFINMTGTNLTNDPTDVLTVASTSVIPSGTSAFLGSLVYCTSNFTLYLRDNTGWIALDTSAASDWASVLATGSTSGGTDPTISSGDQLLYANAIRIGQVGATASAAVNTMSIGALSSTSAGASGSIAIGNNAVVTAGPGIAVGFNATSSAVNSQAFGISSSAAFDQSTAIGYQAVTTLANTIKMGNATTDTLFGRYISTVITEGARAAHDPLAPVGGAINNNDVFVNLPQPYGIIEWENIRPGSGFASYAAVGSVLITLPNDAYFSVHSLVTGAWSGVPNVGPVKSRLVWTDNGVQKNVDAFSSSVTGTSPISLAWSFPNSATLKTGTTGAQTLEVEIAIGVDVGVTYTPTQYYMEVIRIS